MALARSGWPGVVRGRGSKWERGGKDRSGEPEVAEAVAVPTRWTLPMLASNERRRLKAILGVVFWLRLGVGQGLVRLR